MFLKKLKISLAKLIIPLLYKIVFLLKANTRTLNFLDEKRKSANNTYDFQINIKKLLNDKKLVIKLLMSLDNNLSLSINKLNYFL